MSRARKLQLAQARAGVQFWRVTLTRTVKPDGPPTLNVECGGHSTADAIKLMRNAADLLEKQGLKPEQLCDVRTCARCGGDHQRILFKPMDNAGPQCSHFGTCPATGQPILMFVEAIATGPVEDVRWGEMPLTGELVDAVQSGQQ